MTKKETQKKQTPNKTTETSSKKELTLTEETKEQKNTEIKQNFNNTQKEKISKKKLWIIVTSIICAVVLVSIIIASAIVVSRRRLDMTPTTSITYNNHTNLRIVSPANNVSVFNSSNPTYYSNATVLVENEDTSTYGIYSYSLNKTIIPTNYEYAKITPITLNNNGVDIPDTIFKVGNKFGEISNEISFYNDNGENINITNYDSEKQENFAYIKQRRLSVSEKRKGVKVSTKNKFYNEKVYVTDATYMRSYIIEGKYNYEVWNITAKDGTIYKNLYKVEDKQRTLVQTINNLNGNSVELSDAELSIVFLKNDTPAFYTHNKITNVSGNSLININVYDIELNNIGSAQISTEYISAHFIVGNKIIIQSIKPCNDKDFDFSIGYNEFYQLETHSLNLKNGKFKKEKFNYVITDCNDTFNNETVLLTAKKIKDKTLQESQLLLTNDYLNVKEINYEIDTITQISEDRFLVDNNQGQYIIDEKYNQICYLGNYDNYFTTSNAIMLSDDYTGMTYISSLDGTIVKKYATDKITNAHHEKYYMVETTTKKEDGTYNEIYLETLGVRQSSPIYSQKENSTTYTYKGVEYVGYNDRILNDGVSIITRIRKNGETYTYEFYNIDGDKLLQIDNFIFTDRVLNHWHYKDNDNILLYISTNVGGIGYTLIVDR